jgi:ABC-type transporter Mla subunit MlaD
MADNSNLYQELHDALTQFENFIHDNIGTLKTVIDKIKKIVPSIGILLTTLIDLMGKLHDAISKIDVTGIDLTQITQFTSKVKALLQTAEGLLPDQKNAIDEVLHAADVVTALPSLSTIKADILKLLEDITKDLKSLNGSP